MRGPRRGLTLLALLGAFLVLTAVPAVAAPNPSPAPAPGVEGVTAGLNQPVSLVLLLGSLSVLPGLLIMVTAFTRIVIVMGFTRSALGTQAIPPNQAASTPAPTSAKASSPTTNSKPSATAPSPKFQSSKN